MSESAREAHDTSGLQQAPASWPSAVGFGLAPWLVATALYVWLRQPCFHLHDGWQFVDVFRGAHYGANNHYLYLPVGRAFARLCEGFGVEAFVAGGLYSGLLAGLGIGCFGVGLRRAGFDPMAAFLMSMLAAMTPAILLFATVIDAHAPSFGFAGVAFLATVELARKPGFATALLTALAIVVARGFHGSGILLISLFLPWCVWFSTSRLRPSPGFWRTTVFASIAGVLALAGISALAPVVRWLGYPAPDSSLVDIMKQVQDFQPTLAGTWDVVWGEWLWPYFPISGLAFVALFRRKTTLPALLLHASLVPYVFLSMLILTFIRGMGSYEPPLVFTGAVLAIELVGKRWGVAVVAVCTALALWVIDWHEDSRGVRPDYARAAVAATPEPTVYLVWGDWEMDSLLLHGAPKTHVPFYLPNLALVPPAQQLAALPSYKLLFATKALVLTETAEAVLADRNRSQSGHVLAEFFRTAYQHEPIERGEFRGKKLIPKP